MSTYQHRRAKSRAQDMQGRASTASDRAHEVVLKCGALSPNGVRLRCYADWNGTRWRYAWRLDGAIVLKAAAIRAIELDEVLTQ